MRQRKVDRHLPPCVYQKHGAYWLVRPGKWHRLGTNLLTALAEYGRGITEPKGGMADLIEEAFPHITKKVAKSDAHIHDLRAMAITAAKAQGLDAQALAGHTSPAMTRRYLRSKEVPVVDSPIRQSLH